MHLTETCGGAWRRWKEGLCSGLAGRWADALVPHYTSGRRGRQAFSPNLIF